MYMCVCIYIYIYIHTYTYIDSINVGLPGGRVSNKYTETATNDKQNTINNKQAILRNNTKH